MNQKFIFNNMSSLGNPRWIEKYIHSYKNIDEVPDSLYVDINKKIDKLSNNAPEVSIVIIAWNEEVNMLSTISSLADSKTTIPIEIIVVNNNSTDRTQEVLDKLHIRRFMQPMQGCGPARQVGLENAKGKFILTADADCIYPPEWIDGMTNALYQNGVVCAYGKYSFIGNDITPRWKLYIYEKIRDIIVEIRHGKFPYLNTLGMSMSFVKEYALKIGYVMEDIRGEDGKLTLNLMKFGKVKQVKDNKYRIWTGTRTLDKDENLFKSVFLRMINQFKNISKLFNQHLN